MDTALSGECPQFTYLLNNIPPEWVDTYVYLGVKIHKKLNWGDHISGITLKATKILNILRRAMYTCSSDAKDRALVRPHPEYCSPVWSPHQRNFNDAIEREQHGGCME